MEELINRTYDLIDMTWQSFSQKVGHGLISINKEASMQLQYAYLLKNSIDLITYEGDERITIELETGVIINGSPKNIDIVLIIEKGNKSTAIPIELKCYRNRSASGKLRGAQDLFKMNVYEDLMLLESYSTNLNTLHGVQLTMTDARNYVFPKSKVAKSWDYDISQGHSIEGPILITTPIGGKEVRIELNNNYQFRWNDINNYYFLKIIRE